MSLCPFESQSDSPTLKGQVRWSGVTHFAKAELCKALPAAVDIVWPCFYRLGLTKHKSRWRVAWTLFGHFGFVLLEGLRESSLLQRESNWTCQREPLWTIDRTHIDNISLIDVSYRKHIRKTGTLPYKLDGSWYFCVSICRLSWRQIGRSCYWPWSSSSPFW